MRNICSLIRRRLGYRVAEDDARIATVGKDVSAPHKQNGPQPSRARLRLGLLVLTMAVGLTGLGASQADQRPDAEPAGKTWLRVGPLGPLPAAANDRLPLSDQGNKGGWVFDEAHSDEFNADELDLTKWYHKDPKLIGRKPSFYTKENAVTKDGFLQITMREERSPPALAAKGYDHYSTASVKSRDFFSYGYYEIRAKPMRSKGSSAFWFYATEQPKYWGEIDVFEIWAGAPGMENLQLISVHDYPMPNGTPHTWKSGGWRAPYNLADDFHVYGFDWSKEYLKFYVDGVLVYKVENTNSHDPLNLVLDSEVFEHKPGVPDPGTLPSTFFIDYVRIWTKPGDK